VRQNDKINVSEFSEGTTERPSLQVADVNRELSAASSGGSYAAAAEAERAHTQMLGRSQPPGRVGTRVVEFFFVLPSYIGPPFQ
jgi:hypothetical protein